jgi:hypothetical protein
VCLTVVETAAVGGLSTLKKLPVNQISSVFFCRFLLLLLLLLLMHLQGEVLRAQGRHGPALLLLSKALKKTKVLHRVM